MIKKIVSLSSVLMICFFILSSFGGEQNRYNTLAWSKMQKIQWKDFTAKTPKNSKYHATTTTKLSYDLKYDQRKNQPIIEVKCLFIKDESWVKENPTDELLKHERVHFDIAEIASRKIRLAIKKERVLESENFEEKIEKIYKRESNALEKMQKDYDHDTEHSLNAKKQAYWNDKVSKLLKKLAKYASK